MKTKKCKLIKFLSAFLAVIMLLSVYLCIPFSVSAASFTSSTGFVYVKEDDEYISIAGYKGSEINLVIPAEIDGYKVEGIVSSAFFRNNSIESIKISEGIYYIERSAFASMERLNNLEIADSVVFVGDDICKFTPYYYNEDNWIDGCLYCGKYLLDTDCDKIDDTLKIREGTTVIADSACGYIPDLKYCIVPYSVHIIGEYAFSNCRDLQRITLPGNLLYIGRYAFDSCYSLLSVDIPKYIGYIGQCAFSDCTSLKSITTSSESVINIGDGAFDGTPFSDSVKYSNSDKGLYLGKNLVGSSLTSQNLTIKEGTLGIADYACVYREKLVNVYIPDSVTAVGEGAFMDCPSITKISVPASVNSIGFGAFGITNDFGTYYKYKDFAIVGIKGSAAEHYAKSYGMNFIDGSTAKSVSLNRSSLTLGVGEVYTLIKSVNPTVAGGACKWSSSNTSIATVNSNGTVTAKKSGTATISLKSQNGITANCKVNVKAAPSSIKVSTTNLTLGVGEEFIISESTNSGSYAWKFNWSSSNTKVATVAKTSGNKAKIVAKGTGTADITVKTYNGKTATCKVTVKSAPTSVTLSTSNLTLGKGETFIISQNSNSGSYARNFTWSSSNSNVATIEKTSGNKAKITAKSNGTATITIKTYNGKTATCKVTVKNAPSSVKTNPSSVTLGVGETYTVSESTNSGSYANAENLKWSSTDTSVATVIKGSGNKAQIVAKGVGTAYVKITLYNGKTAQCKVTVKPAPTSVKLSTTELTLNTGDEFVIFESTNSGSYANSANLKWESSDSSVATVTKLDANKAKITAKGTGIAVIKLTTYNGNVSTCTVYVNTTKVDIPEDDVQVESSPMIIEDETEIIKESVQSETQG